MGLEREKGRALHASKGASEPAQEGGPETLESDAGPGTNRPEGQTGVPRCSFGPSSFLRHLSVE